MDSKMIVDAMSKDLGPLARGASTNEIQLRVSCEVDTRVRDRCGEPVLHACRDVLNAFRYTNLHR